MFFFFLRSVLCVLKSLFAVVFADVTGNGIMDILRRQCHAEVYVCVTAFEMKAACVGVLISRELPYCNKPQTGE